MTNPVGTEAKRKKLRRCAPFYAQGRSWKKADDLYVALDGLDIAEELARAEQVVEWLAGREAYVLLDRDLKCWRHWRIAADKARWAALDKWDKWKGS